MSVNSTRKKICLSLVLGAAVLIVCDIVFVSLFVYTAEDRLIDLTGSRFDTGVVLFADFGAGQSVGEETKRRLRHALTLLQGGKVNQLLCSGGYRPHRSLAGSQLMVQKLMAMGVEGEKVAAEVGSYDTWSNLARSLDLLKHKQSQRVVIISSPIHLCCECVRS